MSYTSEVNASEDGSVIEHEDIVSTSPNEKEAERQQLQAQIEAFISSGGKIRQIAQNVLADPPKKPQSNYGGQPI